MADKHSTLDDMFSEMMQQMTKQSTNDLQIHKNLFSGAELLYDQGQA